MDPAQLIPVVDPIPIPGPWFDVLLVVTFVAHILFMNVVVGGAVISLVGHARNTEPLSRSLSKKLPTILALTINMGVAPLLFLQTVYGQFDYTSSVLMAGYWLAVIGLLLAAYYGLYIYNLKFDGLGGLRTPLLLLTLGMMLWIGFMFSNNVTLMLRPEKWFDYFKTGGAGFLNLDDPVLYPRYLHFMVASLAVGGLFVALRAHFKKDAERLKTGMLWFMRATVVNLAVGVWFLMALPGEIMMLFMGGDALATGVLALGILGAAALVWTGLTRRPVLAAVLTVVTVLLMAVARHIVRTAYLAPWFDSSQLPITGEYSTLLLFLFFLAVGLPCVVWMVRIYVKPANIEGDA
ncbi:hypothetical protein SAMN02745704_02367 [Paucidesulfovibrio gracilis DSM 16080]|uniref:Uncharacterized protein n=1 Tax=Paucidesulfovibrio gracilis DSM 16080 TaxID=1121449 RepID=A0A1T4XQX4_9BACT|nr:hypothetical protein [Paucidesulfovibrio gracilis]SKA91763.1 hypothetical protein SAMN02745704_02367 [Paucidesulfovibrio gracilis DSM 16080]